jgi:hypothetical protein
VSNEALRRETMMTTETMTTGQMIRRAVELALLIESETAATKELRAKLYAMHHADPLKDGCRAIIEEKEQFLAGAKKELLELEEVA